MKFVEATTSNGVNLRARAYDFRALLHIEKYSEVPVHGSYERAVLLKPGGLDGLGGEGYPMASVNELVARHLTSSGFANIFLKERVLPGHMGTLCYEMISITSLGRDFVRAVAERDASAATQKSPR